MLLAKVKQKAVYTTGGLGLVVGILGVVSLYVENQSKGLFHAYQAWIAFCIFGIIPVRYKRQ